VNAEAAAAHLREVLRDGDLIPEVEADVRAVLHENKRLREEIAQMIEYRRIEDDAMREERKREREDRAWAAYHRAMDDVR